MLEENRQKLQKLGHYNTAMLWYGGEWYWGIDRLHYLVDRLRSLGVSKGEGTPPRIAALELFYSLRSPYSWLALGRIYDIADAFGIDLHIRPVLPMVMRGMAVPRAKLLYIATDTAREAARRNVPFGKFADPVGAGVERCMAVLYYAFGEKRAREFLFAAGEAIWAKGIDVATDKGLRKVTAKAGLFWPDARKAADEDGWRSHAEDNRVAMMDAGSWGVPTMRIGDFVTWGQDRDWLLVRHLEELCDSGEGILV